jgi:hypothetical protein
MVATQRTRTKERVQAANPLSLERDVRQLLADKISGNQAALLALDPHRMRSFSQRQMRRHRCNSEEKPAKMGQGFFLLDCDTDQPVCFKEAPGNLYHELVQRGGLRPEDLQFQGFLATGPREELQSLTRDYPQRWDIEEFFKSNQALGWRRAGTLNLHIRYGQMTMALIAQAAIHQLRLRLGEPAASWDAEHFARNLFGGLEGDIRVSHDTVLITYSNAPNAELLRTHYEDLPEKLRQQGIEPRIPWLYDYLLDFRFK